MLQKVLLIDLTTYIQGIVRINSLEYYVTYCIPHVVLKILIICNFFGSN